jgi:hypothetical protein
MSLLSRAFGVHSHRPRSAGPTRPGDPDKRQSASAGEPLLPADVDQTPLVLLRSPYGRGAGPDSQLLADATIRCCR